MSTKGKKNGLYWWVLRRYGDGRTTTCAGCGMKLTRETMTLDRYPIPGRLGGKYHRANVRPMCRPCNTSHIGEPGYAELTERQRARNRLLRQSFEDAAATGVHLDNFTRRHDGRYQCVCGTCCLNPVNASAHWMVMHIKYGYGDAQPRNHTVDGEWFEGWTRDQHADR